jgi:hypothetical protein
VLAAIPLPKDLTYSERVRAWSVSLVLNWAASLCLLALGYVFPGPGKYDFVANRIYRCLDDHLWQLDNYPSIVDPATFIVYACYATAAVILIKIVASIFEKQRRQANRYGTKRGDNRRTDRVYYDVRAWVHKSIRFHENQRGLQ